MESSLEGRRSRLHAAISGFTDRAGCCVRDVGGPREAQATWASPPGFLTTLSGTRGEARKQRAVQVRPRSIGFCGSVASRRRDQKSSEREADRAGLATTERLGPRTLEKYAASPAIKSP